MPKILLFLLISGCLTALSALDIVKNGKSDYAIVLADANNEMSKLASSELISYLKKSTGAELKVSRTGEKKIVIGLTADLKKKLGSDLPGHNEIRIRTIGNDLYLFGGGKFGTMYAVSTFLEKFVGVRWFTPYADGTYIPRKKDLSIPAVDLREKPGYSIRTMTNWYIHAPKKDIFYLHHKINFNEFSVRFSDIRQNYPQCHTLFSYIRPFPKTRGWRLKWPNKEENDKVYFKSNPEYFSMNAYGKRVPDMQLCFSNPGLRKELLRRMEVQFKTIGAGVYSLSAMDWPGKFCYCKGCKALEKKYQCIGGPMYDFLFEASKTAAKYPGVYISTLAYRKGQSEFPPVIQGKIPDNLVIIFAPINDDVTKTFAHKNNRETYENLKKWTSISKNVWVWYYIYHDSMEGITKRLAEDIRLIHKAGAEGSFFEYKFIYAFSGIGMDEMAIYISMKMFWDPASDWKKHREEYCRYFYGSAADSIIKWMDERERFTEKIPGHILWSASASEWGYYKDPANIIKEEKMIEAWLNKTKSEPFAHANIKRFRLAVDKVLLKNYAAVRKAAPGYKGKSQQIYKRFIDDLKVLAKMRKMDYQNLFRQHARNLSTVLKLAEIDPKPLPEDFKPNGKRVVRFFPDRNGSDEGNMKDAAWGFVYGREVKEPEKGMSFGYYDILARVQKNSRISFDQIKKDGFHIYHVKTTKLSASCRVWCHPSWGLGYQAVGSLFDVDFPDKVWDIYVSLKFTGPAYEKNPETKKNYVWLDQVILVEK